MHRGAYVHIYTIKQDEIAFAGHDLLNFAVLMIVGDGFAATCGYMGAPGPGRLRGGLMTCRAG
jgi:hypothetical protein